MNFFRLLFLACFAVVAVAVFSNRPEAQPEIKAQEFMQAVKSGDLLLVESLFGDNTCNCPPRGGYKSFLQYESGQEPNLAFLLGKEFTFGPLTIHALPDKGSYLIPWQRPESAEVDIPIRFSEKNAPWFLPLPMAFGYDLSPEDWLSFLQQPSKDADKGFCLRLRNNLQPGFIKPPVLDDKERLLPVEVTRYLKPADPGRVLQNQKQQLSLSDIQSKLPRLASVTCKLKVVRRGQIDRWTIARFNFSQPTFTLPIATPATQPAY